MPDPFVIIPQTMVNGTGNFILLAVPFFILAGLIMERGGISVRLIRFIQSAVGHARGGLLQVAVPSMYVVSGLSGSKPADVAAVGTVMRDELRERHGAAEGGGGARRGGDHGRDGAAKHRHVDCRLHHQRFGGGLFIGGLIPAAVMALCLMLLIDLRTRRGRHAPHPPRAARHMLRAGLGAMLPLLDAGDASGRHSAGDRHADRGCGFRWCVYGLVLSMLIYREMSLRDFGAHRRRHRGADRRAPLHLRRCVGVFVDADGGLPAAAAGRPAAFGRQQHRHLHGRLDRAARRRWRAAGGPAFAQRSGSAADLRSPAELGLSELHYALVLIIAMGIGGFMPLAGVGFYVCCAIMRAMCERASRAMLPYLVVVLSGRCWSLTCPGWHWHCPGISAFGYRKSGRMSWLG